MNNESIAAIAESLDCRHSRVNDGYILVDVFGNVRKFDPYINWADTGLVLEALRKKVMRLEIEGDFLYFTLWPDAPTERSGPRVEVDATNLQAAICKAYLSSIQEHRI